MADADPAIDKISKFMDTFIDRIFLLSQQNLVEDGKVDTGLMIKTARVERDPLEKRIIYPTPYASDVEFGRVPGTMPPVKSLEKWVRRKLGVKPADAKKTAWAVAMNIKKRGIQPTFFLDRAIKQAKSEFGV